MTRMPSVKLAASDCSQVIRSFCPVGRNVTASRSVRSALGSGTTAAGPRETTLVGTSRRMFEYDHRVRGKRKALPSANWISLSAGGGEPTIHCSTAGSLEAASSRSVTVPPD